MCVGGNWWVCGLAEGVNLDTGAGSGSNPPARLIVPSLSRLLAHHFPPVIVRRLRLRWYRLILIQQRKETPAVLPAILRKHHFLLALIYIYIFFLFHLFVSCLCASPLSNAAAFRAAISTLCSDGDSYLAASLEQVTQSQNLSGVSKGWNKKIKKNKHG